MHLVHDTSVKFVIMRIFNEIFTVTVDNLMFQSGLLLIEVSELHLAHYYNMLLFPIISSVETNLERRCQNLM